METTRVEIKNKMGLHARPIAKLVKVSESIDSVVQLRSSQATANISNIYELMALGLECGDQVEIFAEGDGAAGDLAMIKELFETSFGEE